MIQGNFYQVDNRFSGYSFYKYTAVVKDGEENVFPIHLKLSPSYIGFYIHLDNSEIPTNQLLFHIPLKNQNGVHKPAEILKSIFHEGIKIKGIQKINLNKSKVIRYYQKADFQASSTILKRQIFLDFLFDLNHSQAFHNYEYFDELWKFVQENFFISSILYKHDFFFFRREYLNQNPLSNPVKGNQEQLKNQQNVLSEKLRDAEERWLNQLFRNESNDFSFSNGWFEDSEEEIKEVIFPEIEQNQKNKTVTFNRKDWHKEFLNQQDKTSVELEEKKLIRERIQILDFFISRYEYFQSYRWVNFTNPPFGVFGKLFLSKPFIFSWLLLIFLLFLILKKINFYLLVTGLIGLTLGMFLPFSIFVFAFIGFVGKKIGKIWSPSLRLKNMNPYPLIDLFKLSTPKMTISILVGWLALFPFSEELWEINTKLEENLYWFLGLFVILFFIVSSVIFFEIKSVEPIQRFNKSVIKVIRVFFIGMSFSIGVGIFMLHFSCIYMFDNKDFFIGDFKGKEAFESIKRNTLKVEEAYQLHTKVKSVNISAENLKDSIRLWRKKIEQVTFDTIYLKDIITQFENDTTLVLKKRKEILLNQLKVKVDELNANTYAKNNLIVREYAKSFQHNQFPLICYVDLSFLKLFLFPKLLILKSLIAFILGFFIQFILEAKAFKQPL